MLAYKNAFRPLPIRMAQAAPLTPAPALEPSPLAEQFKAWIPLVVRRLSISLPVSAAAFAIGVAGKLLFSRMFTRKEGVYQVLLGGATALIGSAFPADWKSLDYVAAAGGAFAGLGLADVVLPKKKQR